MLLATTQVEDFDRFLEVFSTKGAEKRKQHGSKGALVFRDPSEDDRVWVIFDWDEQGWQSFVSDPEVPPIMKEAGHKGEAAGRRSSSAAATPDAAHVVTVGAARRASRRQSSTDISTVTTLDPGCTISRSASCSMSRRPMPVRHRQSSGNPGPGSATVIRIASGVNRATTSMSSWWVNPAWTMLFATSSLTISTRSSARSGARCSSVSSRIHRRTIDSDSTSAGNGDRGLLGRQGHGLAHGSIEKTAPSSRRSRIFRRCGLGRNSTRVPPPARA